MHVDTVKKKKRVCGFYISYRPFFFPCSVIASQSYVNVYNTLEGAQTKIGPEPRSFHYKLEGIFFSFFHFFFLFYFPLYILHKLLTMSDLNWCTYCDNAISPFSVSLIKYYACIQPQLLTLHRTPYTALKTA